MSGPSTSTAVGATSATPAPTPPSVGVSGAWQRLPSWARWPVMTLGVILLLTIAGRVADTPGLTGSGMFSTALGFTVPILLAGLAGLVAERVGVVNIGIEGMMILGTWGAGLLGWKMGPWGALLGGAIGGALGGLIHALATVTFGVNQVVSGVAINLLAPGLTRYLANVYFEPNGGSISDSPPVGVFSNLSLPFFAGGTVFGWKTPDIFGNLEGRGWFLISDVAALIRGFTGDMSWSTLLLVSLLFVVWYLLWRTPWGLRLRAIGEKPTAAESLGVKVAQIKWIGVTLSGALAGLGGSWLVINTAKYQAGQVAGRGFLGIAALIIGNWQAFIVALAALLFSFADAVKTAGIFNEPKGLLLSAAVAFAGLGAWRAVGVIRSGDATGTKLVFPILMVIGGVAAAIGAANAAEINKQLVFALPYLLTLFVLWFASGRQRPPAAAGLIWRRGQVN